jgi:hypothetical protein
MIWPNGIGNGCIGKHVIVCTSVRARLGQGRFKSPDVRFVSMRR